MASHYPQTAYPLTTRSTHRVVRLPTAAERREIERQLRATNDNDADLLGPVDVLVGALGLWTLIVGIIAWAGL